ncbi:Svx/AvrXca family virulence/avirulence protein [Asticcacaulis sp. BYS171W]|uniref:Svx/AvrXca family virulence/avirulence protein n=1 Tax=Asticcacaulis aquaticus TaxID=2984212 RepID=A0ABT5HTR7_9CAUL|nr:Svx/AvrXca family virulence/avirulence protein [Asticcacaulis aquaticus]MDC7683434.1 Svx/AvrXca family virulence/avirulence protein [Asticcacaulis aquaticus]
MRALISTAALLTALAVSSAANAQEGNAREACKSGTYTVVSGTPEEAPVQYETEHYAFRWKEGAVNKADAVSAGEKLEYIWKFYMQGTEFAVPYCDTDKKHKANINLDPTFALSGGPTGERDMGMWIHPLSLKDNWGLAHEFAHGLQGASRGFRDSIYSGWLWENHANWITHQLPFFRDNVHCSEMLVNFPHLYYGSTRDRYCSWQFLEYLKNEYGYAAVNDLWSKALKPGQAGYEQEDPFVVLMRTQGWSVADLNDVFGNWALHNVNWDYINPDGADQGVVYREKYGSYDQRDGQRVLRVTQLDPIDAKKRQFAVPFDWAPQRWGYNIVKLIPDAGAKKVTVTFRGVVQAKPANALPGLTDEPKAVADPGSNWRWGVVAIGANGKSRISPVVDGADGDMIFPVRADDKALYLVVMGAPDIYQKIQWDQPWHSVYRYPWMASFDGAMPEGYQAGAPAPSAKGHKHKNGGGWVADGAQVDDTVYVGPQARVLGGKVTGRARIEDHALILSGEVSGDAVVGGLSIISNGVTVKDKAVVRTSFMGIGMFEPKATIGGTAKLYGDVELRGGPTLSKGAYSGFVDQASQDDPKKGADLTDIPSGITAHPDYVWRP